MDSEKEFHAMKVDNNGSNNSNDSTDPFFINTDYLSNNGGNSGGECSNDSHDDIELPSSLIATGLPISVFNDESTKSHFESLFKKYENSVQFLYLKSFRRVRIDFNSPAIAAAARIQYDEGTIAGETFNTYFIQPTYDRPSDEHHLLPPPLEKQFLISPPASPPVGWEQSREAEPVINFELLSCVAALTPGEEHEVHSPTDNLPGITISTCIDEADRADGSENDESRDYFTSRNVTKPKIVQTRRPERKL